ncbi:MAG TPA: SRPBCC family protein [Solirubrobacteraceae bacterium]|jgi:phenylpropionate dioxygenase-like ring-hydroxylating dioxygenase large terminal subunit|nr:SRPBCC family protein [Solirubrobacteraceae bacterium]
MRHETQVQLLRRFFEMRREHTTTLGADPYVESASVYTDPERARLELERIFRRRPLLVALSSDLPDIGSYSAIDCAGLPALLVRSEDGLVRGFVNICRHRGGRVASGQGRTDRALKCPYHSWAYDLDGMLLGQPLARHGFDGLDRCEFGLLPLSVAERYGLVYLSAEAERAIDVEAELHGLGPELGEFALDDYVPFAQRSGVFDANWKLLYDTFLESYHIFSLHRDSIAGQLLSTPLVSDLFGPHGRAAVMTRDVGGLLEREEADWDLRRHCTVVYTIYPSMLLNFPSSGHLDRWEIYPEPGSPDRARATFTLYAPKARLHETAFWEANVAFTERVVFGEDFAQQQDIHRSLRCGRLPGVVFGRNEPVLTHHHVVTEAALQDASLPAAAGRSARREQARSTP